MVVVDDPELHKEVGWPLSDGGDDDQEDNKVEKKDRL